MTCTCDGFCTGMCELYRIRELAGKLFTDYLDVTEESDNGYVFHPVTISCCRALKLESLEKLLIELKELSLEPQSEPNRNSP